MSALGCLLLNNSMRGKNKTHFCIVSTTAILSLCYNTYSYVLTIKLIVFRQWLSVFHCHTRLHKEVSESFLQNPHPFPCKISPWCISAIIRDNCILPLNSLRLWFTSTTWTYFLALASVIFLLVRPERCWQNDRISFNLELNNNKINMYLKK